MTASVKCCLFLGLLGGVALACTNFLVTPGASVDGSSIISYAADSHALFGGLYYSPAAKYPKGTMMDVVDWDSGHYIGKISQATETYNVAGNTNEHGLAIGETTYGGLEALQVQSKALVDYGSLIYIALQRCKTAREAVLVMTDLVQQYGYYSQGESFSIADPKEVWVLEMIGKGEYELGAVWVALRVPDGHVTSHANQARITTFPRNDPSNCLFSQDVVSFAKAHGFYPAAASEEEFSFSDVYAPAHFSGVRGCEMRAWSFFRSVVGTAELDQYKDYVSGKNMTHRMPWSFVPSRKLSHRDIMRLMGDHFEGTDFDFSQDVGAGPFHAPYRWRPMDFKVGGHSYTNERSAATQQTAWVFVAQLKPNMPERFSALNWFGLDDAATTVFIPLYGAMTQVPRSLALEGNGAIMKFSLSSSFWVFNLVSQMAYDRWDIIYPEVRAAAGKLQDEFDRVVKANDARLAELARSGRMSEAVAYATKESLKASENTYNAWLSLWSSFVPRFVDGYTKKAVPGEQNPEVRSPGYGQAWYDRIVNETGDKYLIPEEVVAAERSVAPHLRRHSPNPKI